MALLSVTMDSNTPDTARAAGFRAREIIRRKGFRHGWVAEQLGISSSYLSLLLSGARRMTDERRSRLAEVLGVPPGELS